MANMQNSNLNYTGLVQKYIGTAYDKVARVADSILGVDLVAESIADGIFQYVVDNMDAIMRVVQDIEDFRNIYYGMYPEHPLTDPSGNPIDLGDMYYNTTENQLYIYAGKYYTDPCDITTIIGGEWVPIGACSNTRELIITQSDHLASGNIPLKYFYIPGQGNLEVFVNNIRQISTTTSGVYGAYNEVDGSNIAFLTNKIADGNGNLVSLKLNDQILIVIGTLVANVNHQVLVSFGRYVTEVANEQTITLPRTDEHPDGMRYNVGTHNLEVFVKDNQHSREVQVLDLDYLEVDATRIQFITPLPQYAEVIFKVGTIVSNLNCEAGVLMMDQKPTEIYYKEGQFWYNTGTGRLSILYKDNDSLQWIDISEEHTILHDSYVPPPDPPPVLTNATIFQPLKPEEDLFAEGTLWFHTGTSQLYILYSDDGDQGNGASPQWVKISHM